MKEPREPLPGFAPWEFYNESVMQILGARPADHGRIVGTVDLVWFKWTAYGKYGKRIDGRAFTEGQAFADCEKAIRKLWLTPTQ